MKHEVLSLQLRCSTEVCTPGPASLCFVHCSGPETKQTSHLSLLQITSCIALTLPRPVPMVTGMSSSPPPQRGILLGLPSCTCFMAAATNVLAVCSSPIHHPPHFNGSPWKLLLYIEKRESYQEIKERTRVVGV